MKKIIIDDNEELIIPKRTSKFLLGCCNCGLIHKVEVSRKGKEIILKFKRLRNGKI